MALLAIISCSPASAQLPTGPTPSSSTPTTGIQQYTNSNFGFTVKYPSDWKTYEPGDANPYAENLVVEFSSPSNSLQEYASASIYVTKAGGLSIGTYTLQNLRKPFNANQEPAIENFGPGKLSRLDSVNMVWKVPYPTHTFSESWMIYNGLVYHIVLDGIEPVYQKYENELKNIVNSFEISNLTTPAHPSAVVFDLDGSDYQSYKSWHGLEFNFSAPVQNDSSTRLAFAYSISANLTNSSMNPGRSITFGTDGRPGKIVLDIPTQLLNTVEDVEIDGLYAIKPIVLSSTNSSSLIGIPYRLASQEFADGIDKSHRGNSIEVRTAFVDKPSDTQLTSPKLEGRVLGFAIGGPVVAGISLYMWQRRRALEQATPVNDAVIVNAAGDQPMAGLDKERFLAGKRWVAFIAASVAIIISAVLSFLLFIVAVADLPSQIAHPDDTRYNFGYGWALTIASVFFGGVIVSVLFLRRYQTHLYNSPIPKGFTITLKDSRFPTFPSKCRLCGRHPVSRKYHIRHIHKIKSGRLEDYFEDCGCKYCRN